MKAEARIQRQASAYKDLANYAAAVASRDRLIAEALDAGLTSEEVGEIVGLSAQHVRRIASGGRR